MKYIKTFENTKQLKDYILVKSLVSIAQAPYFIIKVSSIENNYIYFDRYKFYVDDEDKLTINDGVGKISFDDVIIYAQAKRERTLLKKLKELIINSKFNL